MKKLLLFIALLAIMYSCKSSSGKLHEEFEKDKYKTKPTIFTGINVQIDTANKYLLICDTSYLVDKTTITTHSKYQQMKTINLTPQEYTSVFLELASQAKERFQILKSNSHVIVLLVSVRFAAEYGF